MQTPKLDWSQIQYRQDIKGGDDRQLLIPWESEVPRRAFLDELLGRLKVSAGDRGWAFDFYDADDNRGAQFEIVGILEGDVDDAEALIDREIADLCKTVAPWLQGV